jgi:hypothetical protein
MLLALVLNREAAENFERTDKAAFQHTSTHNLGKRQHGEA